MDFQNFQKLNFDGGKFLKISLGSREIPQKFGPNRFSRFGVYWIQTNKHAKFIFYWNKWNSWERGEPGGKLGVYRTVGRGEGREGNEKLNIN